MSRKVTINSALLLKEKPLPPPTGPEAKLGFRFVFQFWGDCEVSQTVMRPFTVTLLMGLKLRPISVSLFSDFTFVFLQNPYIFIRISACLVYIEPEGEETEHGSGTWTAGQRDKGRDMDRAWNTVPIPSLYQPYTVLIPSLYRSIA